MFKVGQKVVCINNKPIGFNPYNGSLSKLKEKEIYTIKGFTSTGIRLKEVKSSHPDGGYNANRFRKIDNDWVEELLCKLMSDFKVNQLVKHNNRVK
jgi:hypothetical protein